MPGISPETGQSVSGNCLRKGPFKHLWVRAAGKNCGAVFKVHDLLNPIYGVEVGSTRRISQVQAF